MQSSVRLEEPLQFTLWRWDNRIERKKNAFQLTQLHWMRIDRPSNQSTSPKALRRAVCSYPRMRNVHISVRQRLTCDAVCRWPCAKSIKTKWSNVRLINFNSLIKRIVVLWMHVIDLFFNFSRRWLASILFSSSRALSSHDEILWHRNDRLSDDCRIHATTMDNKFWLVRMIAPRISLKKSKLRWR